MQIRLLSSICFLLFSVTSLASARIDSVGIENLNGKKIILHKIEIKENYYSIARKYNVSPKSIIEFNNNKSLQPNAILKVPTDRPFIKEEKKNSTIPGNPTLKTAVIEYKVGPKETLYSISKRFNTTVADLKSINNLTDNSLSIGQIIKIPSITGTATNQAVIASTTPETIQVTKEENPPTSQIDSNVNAGDRLKLPLTKYGLREVDERGVAIWISDENLDGTKMLALHRTAPIGTIVKITNPMTGKSTFAKVVGKFTENETTKDAIIVITKATADLVGALDKRFQVNVVYGVPNE